MGKDIDMRIAGIAVVLLIAGVSPCWSQTILMVEGQTPDMAEPAPDKSQPAPRYAFNRVNDGFLRLDNVTGNVSYCGPTSVGWACQAVPEDRAALETEIARLQDEVASLKQAVA